MRKIFIIIIVLIFVFSCAKRIPDIKYSKLSFGDDNSLEVMTWNIQHFPKNEHTVNYVARIIKAIDVDIIGLQEIENDKAFSELVKKLNKIDHSNKWSGYRADTDEWNLNLAYIYKSNIVKVDSIYEIFYQDKMYNRPFPRKPLVMEFIYQGENFYIINNHLKAMSGKENEARRKEASNLLKKYITNNLSEEEVFVLGDLNDILTDSEQKNVFLMFINDSLNFQFADMEIAVDSTADWSYPYWKYRGHIDHILISNELFDEFKHTDSCIKTITIDKFMEGGEEARYKYITDHRPLAIKLRIVE